MAAVLSLSYICDSHAIEDAAAYKEWSERLTDAARHHDVAEELLSLNTIGRRWSWALTTLPPQLIEQAGADSERMRPGASRIELLQMLYDVRWRRRDGSEPSRWWRQLSQELLERGQLQEAVAVAAHITDPYELIALQVDNRYARIVRSNLVESDILKAAEKELERRRMVAANMPRSLSPLLQVGRQSLLLHHYDETLRLTDAVIERSRAATPESSPYDDMTQQLPWILNLRSRALRALGRYDEALELLQRAHQESKDDLVSHSLNLAGFLVQLNRPQEALAAIPALEHANEYGRAIAVQVRVIAAAELNDSEALQSALTEMRAAGEEHPGVYEHALIAAGRDEEAATVLMARLSNPDQRSDALVELQDFADIPAPTLVLAWRARLKALRDRPEMHRAITAYGRVRRYPLPGTFF